MEVLNWHRFSVAANVTFITSFLFYSYVSSDLQRRGEREVHCDLVVLHIRCSVLAAGSSLSSFSDMFFFFSPPPVLIYPGVLLCSEHGSAEEVRYRLIFTV